MSQYLGPEFQFVETIEWDELQSQGGFQPRSLPLLVKGAVKQWPAWECWAFDKLAQLKRPDGGEVVTSVQNGLVEQGVTRQPLIQPVAPYLRELAARAANYQRERRDDIGLLPEKRRHKLGKDDKFHLDWGYMQSFVHDRAYLAQWHILNE